MGHLQGLVGIFGVLAVGWLFSTARSRINWRVVLGGVALQFVLAYLLLRFEPVVAVFDKAAAGFDAVIGCADAGIVFVFGPNLASPSGPWGFIFAVRVLPVIIFFASLMSILYYLRVSSMTTGTPSSS